MTKRIEEIVPGTNPELAEIEANIVEDKPSITVA